MTKVPLPAQRRYLIILGDSFEPLLLAAFGGPPRQASIAFISCAIILPLCFPRTLGALAGRQHSRSAAQHDCK